MADPFTQSLRSFFAGKLGPLLSAQGIGLHFDPFPSSVPLSEFTEADGSLNRTKAAEFFSRHIADRAAYVDGETRIPGRESLSETIRHQVLGKAILFPRFDRSEELQAKDMEVFEALLADAKRKMQSVAALGALPIEYVPSEAVPVNWLDPKAAGLWSHYAQTLRNDTAEPDPASPPEPLKLPWKKFDPDRLKDVLRDILPGRLLPHRERPRLPPWADPSPLPESWGHVLKETGPVAGPGGLGAHGGLQRFMSFDPGAQFSDDPQLIFKKLFDAHTPADSLVKLEDVEPADALRRADWDATTLFKAGVLPEATSNAPSEVKDEVKVSFDYQVVEIRRDWLFWPFLEDSNWYIDGARRGELTIGMDGQNHGILNLIPERIIVIKDLTIKAAFDDADFDAINEAFALGPFRIDRQAAIQEGVLSNPGLQVIAYIDRAAPLLPPRSDPKFVV